MAAPTVLVITNAKLALAADEASLPTAPDYSCQVVMASINATPNLQDVPATFCAPAGQTAGQTGYVLAVTWLQDWTAPGGGLSGYAYTNDAEQVFFSLTLNEDVEPVATGSLILTAGSYGGEAGVPLQSEAEWPIQGKPQITFPAGAPLAAKATAKATA